VIGTARNPDAAESFKILSQTYPACFRSVPLDVTNEASIVALPVLLESVQIDCLINNAGISLEEDFGSWTSQGFEANFQANTLGPALVSQAMTSLMGEGAKIVNMSSGMASIELNLNPQAGLDAYAVSKAGLNFVTRRLAEKLKERAIAVVAVSPGWVRTEMGGADATASVEEAVQCLVQTIDTVTIEQTGAFLAETGEPLPW
jgi:NAD(P)-dependent dehydrogenase (short-subunit alcohol dehydrogenase family)